MPSVPGARQQSMDALDEVAAHAHVAVRGDGPVELALAAIADALDRELFIAGSLTPSR